jgi:hypothetical protein
MRPVHDGKNGVKKGRKRKKKRPLSENPIRDRRVRLARKGDVDGLWRSAPMFFRDSRRLETEIARKQHRSGSEVGEKQSEPTLFAIFGGLNTKNCLKTGPLESEVGCRVSTFQVDDPLVRFIQLEAVSVGGGNLGDELPLGQRELDGKT